MCGSLENYIPALVYFGVMVTFVLGDTKPMTDEPGAFGNDQPSSLYHIPIMSLSVFCRLSTCRPALTLNPGQGYTCG